MSDEIEREIENAPGATERLIEQSWLGKTERGIALATDAATKVTKAEPVAVLPGMTVAEGFQAIVTACIRHFQLNEPIVLEHSDAEALHQLRVAMRRLRTALSLFRPAMIRDDELGRIEGELKWFTGELGDARNLDVYLLRRLAVRDRRAIERKREAAYARAIAALESTRFRLLILDVVAWISLGEWRRGKKAGEPLAPFANRRIDRLWSKVSDARVGKMDDRQRHRLRIRIKKLRYALEFVEALHVHRRKNHKKFGKAVEDVQEALGYFHDVVVARQMVASGLLPNVPQPERGEEGPHLRDAKRSLRQLRKAGPYWRKAA